MIILYYDYLYISYSRELLCRADYEYTLKRTNKDGTKLWRYAKKICNATIKTKYVPMLILNETTHVHNPKVV